MRFRTLLLLSILRSTFAFGQDLSRPIDYTTKAVALETAIAQIAKQSGVKLFVQDELAKEPIILRLKAVTLQDAMAKIADAVGAEWVKKPDGYDLIRSAAIEDGLTKDEANAGAKSFRDSITKH